jgi:hypothetical protein
VGVWWVVDMGVCVCVFWGGGGGDCRFVCMSESIPQLSCTQYVTLHIKIG